MNTAASAPFRHPLLPRGVWLAPVVLPDGRDVAVAVTRHGVMIGRESHEPAEWPAVYARLSLMLDELDPLTETAPKLKLA